MTDTVRVGIVGGGIRGSMFARVVEEHPHAELVGFCEPSQQVADKLKADFGATIVGSTDELLDAGADAVVIATPDFAHREPGLAALQRGVDVLFEKPLATTVEDAQALRDAAGASSSKVMVGYENRWQPRFQAVRRLLQESQAPVIAQRVLLQDTEFVPRQMLSWAARSTPGWFLFPHSLDMAMWLGGAYPVEVFARGVKKILGPDGIDTYDRISASFLMSDDSIVDLDSGWVLPESRASVFTFRYDVEARGEQFEIEIDRSGITRYDGEAVSFVGGPETDHRGRLVGAPIDMMRDFIDVCRGEQLDVPGIEDGYRVAVAVAAVHESLETNTNTVIRY